MKLLSNFFRLRPARRFFLITRRESAPRTITVPAPRTRASRSSALHQPHTHASPIARSSGEPPSGALLATH